MTCVHKSLSTFCTYFSHTAFLQSFLTYQATPLLSILKVLLTMIGIIEKISSKCQSRRPSNTTTFQGCQRHFFFKESFQNFTKLFRATHAHINLDSSHHNLATLDYSNLFFFKFPGQSFE